MLCSAGAIETAFEFFAGRAASGFVIPEWLPTPENLQYHAAVARLDTAVYGIIDTRQQELLASPTRAPEVNTYATCHLSDAYLSGRPL